MPHKHIVKQGECLSLIARRYGFANYRTVYDHADNAELRELRPNPNVLSPGDVVVIPDKDTKTESVATGKFHRFEVATPAKALRIVEMQPLMYERLKSCSIMWSLSALSVRGENSLAAVEPYSFTSGRRDARIVLQWLVGRPSRR